MSDNEFGWLFAFVATGLIFGTIIININQNNQSYRECIKTDRPDCIKIIN